MEASEHQRLLPDASVRVLDGRLVIERLQIEDDRAARVVRESAESGNSPADTVAKAIEIGARVIDNEGTAANVDYVRAELEKGVGPLRRELAETLETGNQALAERIAASFGSDRSDSVQQQIKDMFTTANVEQRTAISRLFSSEDGSNPLTDFKAAVVRGMTESEQRRQVDRESDRKRMEDLMGEIVVLREKLGAKDELEAEQDRGTAKGRTFEDQVTTVIERIAAGRGDEARAVGDERSGSGGKKGDIVVEIEAQNGPATGKIVFEVKNSKLTKPEAWRVLNGALVERDASFAVLVVAKDEQVPAQTQPLCEYDGNKLIVPTSPDLDDLSIEFAYRYARAKVLTVRDRELEVDAAGVRDCAQEALSALNDARKIRSSLTGVTNSAESARVALDSMVEAVRMKLEQVESLIADAHGVEAPPEQP